VLAFVALPSIALPPSGFSQDAPAAPATPTAPAARNTADDALKILGTGNLESNTLLTIIKTAFDTNSDAINPEDGTIQWKGHTWNLGQFRVFRARFERYLALPTSTDSDIYRAIVNEVLALLSTRSGNNAQDNITKAWQLLYRAAEYDDDGSASLTVANQVFNAWRIRDEKEAFRITQIELDRMRRQQRGDVVYGGDTLARVTGERIRGATPGDSPSVNVNTGDNNKGTNKGKGKSSDTPKQDAPVAAGPVGLGFRMRDLTETEAKIKSAEASELLTGAQAKLQFQTALVNLFLQRRFQHCLIAASFYRYIFKGTAQDLEVGKKEISSFLPSTDLAISIETLEYLSREAINDVDTSMQAIRASYDEGQHILALERLQETFFLGEYVPAVTQFERDKKQKLLELYRKVDQARKLADLKDYDAVDKITGDIGTLASDFRSAEVTSAIRAAQRMSTLALNAAQQAAFAEDYIKAQEYVEKAAMLWPLNPAIKAYTDSMTQKVDIGSQGALAFDEAGKRQDFRSIYDRRAELSVALMSDTRRAPQLKDIIERMSRIEIYLTQARELLAQNNPFAAWEALQTATPLAPTDVILNQRKAELAPRVAEFAGRLDAARRHEEGGRYADALTQYLTAQDIYPASTIARLGVERVSGLLLENLSPTGASGAVATEIATPATAEP
jgi:tetratricopeptide (TPR) repeat protein